MKDQTLSALVRKTISGDPEAFEQLMISQDKPIAMKILRITNRPEEIDDIKQKVALRIFQKIETLKSPEAFSSWMNTIIERECIRHLSTKDPAIPLENPLDVEGIVIETDAEYLPLAHIESKELYEDIHKVLDRMPEATRQMMILHYEYEMGYKEIADVMGAPIGTVSANLYRGKTRLRRDLPLA